MSIKIGASLARVLLNLIILSGASLLNGCSFQRPIEREQLADLGYFEYREPEAHMAGVVIGAPHGLTDPDAALLTRQISDRTGAGLVAAYGFKGRHLGVDQPVVRAVHDPRISNDPVKRGSVFREFKKVLHRTASGDVDFYIGIRSGFERDGAADIEVTSSGVTLEQTKILKESYVRIRNGWPGTKPASQLSIAIDPLDNVSRRVSGVRHHGVLMIAEKGINLRIAQGSLSKQDRAIYVEILSAWVLEAARLVRENPQRVEQIDVRLMDFGRVEMVKSRRLLNGIVIGSPHGSFDQNTAETVSQLAARTGFAAVIAKGFTPTETGGWRINVNRPTERSYPQSEFELRSERAQKVYEAYKALVMEAANGDLDLYLDIHGYGTNSVIQVATVGVRSEQARKIKAAYREIRDQTLKHHPRIEPVDLLIEPLDHIEIGAWNAKATGILSVAQKSLHFELPIDGVLGRRASRDVYTRILGDLLRMAVVALADPQ
ncbi:MAG: hypothetical protein ACREQ7_23475 [Candidatus Binatia bacterium]